MYSCIVSTAFALSDWTLLWLCYLFLVITMANCKVDFYFAENNLGCFSLSYFSGVMDSHRCRGAAELAVVFSQMGFAELIRLLSASYSFCFCLVTNTSSSFRCLKTVSSSNKLRRLFIGGRPGRADCVRLLGFLFSI